MHNNCNFHYIFAGQQRKSGVNGLVAQENINERDRERTR